MPGDVIQLRLQIAAGTGRPMERDGKPVRFVAHPLEKQQTRIAGRKRQRLRPIACHDQLLFLGEADRDEIRQPEPLQRGIRGGELALAAVDHDEIGKRSAILEQSPVSPRHDFLHRGKVVIL